MSSAIIPVPRCSIGVRVAAHADLPFIDALQKQHTHMVGWMPTKQIEGKIAAGHVLIAEETSPLGYCIAHDQYMKRDDVGIIYQLNVLPLKQRNLIGATLIKAVFERAAYGCRLFCCWCAQDIQANYFWESIGFIPLAFRAGSRGKQRIHIFWQRRVRENDDVTPWWYPSETKSGAIREDRIVLPIPPGVSWRDAKPILLPGMPATRGELTPRALPPKRPPAPSVPTAMKVAIVRSQSKHLGGLPAGKAAVITSAGLRYVDRADYVPEPPPVKPKRAPKPAAAKNDQRVVAAARELRDRYLEQLNAGTLLPDCKYDVSRLQEARREPLLVEYRQSA